MKKLQFIVYLKASDLHVLHHKVSQCIKDNYQYEGVSIKVLPLVNGFGAGGGFIQPLAIFATIPIA
mgnify:FL=1